MRTHTLRKRRARLLVLGALVLAVGTYAVAFFYDGAVVDDADLKLPSAEAIADDQNIAAGWAGIFGSGGLFGDGEDDFPGETVAMSASSVLQSQGAESEAGVHALREWEQRDEEVLAHRQRLLSISKRPHYQNLDNRNASLRRVREFLEGDLRLCIATARVDRAFEDWVALSHLATSLLEQNNDIGRYLIAHALLEGCARSAVRLAMLENCSPMQMERLQTLLQALPDTRPALDAALVAAYQSVKEADRDRLLDELDVSKLQYRGNRTLKLLGDGVRGWRALVPLDYCMWRPLLVEAERKIESRASGVSEFLQQLAGNLGGERLAHSQDQSMHHILCRHLAREAALRCAIAALAVQRYQRAHGTYPTQLEELVPVFLEQLPQDPFVGVSVRYAPHHGFIYSVGIDGEGEGGSVDEGKQIVEPTVRFSVAQAPEPR